MKLINILELIKPVNNAVYAACLERFDAIAKPVGSLGGLETLLARIGAVYADENIDIGKKCVLVFCADNGVVSEGVARNNEDVTTAIARMMALGKSSVCVMAEACGAQVFPVDVGMKDTVKGLIDRKIMNGTGNISNGPAMSRDMAVAAMEVGARLARQKQREGFRLVATGEVGIGNTTTASAMASVLLDRPVAEMTGRGAGLSDEGLSRKIAVIEQAINHNRPNPDDPLDILCKLGGLDIAAMTGVFLGGAAYGVPVVMDGVISAVAALCAVRIKPLVRDYIIPSHISAEPASPLLCQALGLEPILKADMRLGEGTGAVALFPLLDMAAAVYHRAALLVDIVGVPSQEDLC
ncbi:MAG: nicotinate-nucleotide--dimethylbenzimidazole phosphoribosyltransferase [Syntrophomonadaceae bacterium]|nr:nicotinate-nucleotide--dimethylbenzimidazole phosphoribosyltransferase [Syntrophomonadaceae bacterium]